MCRSILVIEKKEGIDGRIFEAVRQELGKRNLRAQLLEPTECLCLCTNKHAFEEYQLLIVNVLALGDTPLKEFLDNTYFMRGTTLVLVYGLNEPDLRELAYYKGATSVLLNGEIQNLIVRTCYWCGQTVGPLTSPLPSAAA